MAAHARSDDSVWRFLGTVLSWSLLAVILALGVVVIAVPKLAGAMPLTVLTSSMKPGLPPGTLLVVKPVATEDIKIGDVITYQIHSGVPGVISHRVTGITLGPDGTRSFVLKGDNNSAADAEPVIGPQVQGRLWYSVPFLGYANTLATGTDREWIVRGGGVLLLGYALALIGKDILSRRRQSSGRRTAQAE
ncbi:signal peptidase I [Agreia pratensis]|uniref:Signal peptidase I n=1 Tax=Agreia pratensis TaxID=150121 RepID=A0A1X7I407_9MICO|nr:signal peptidase I [Agreia pratensis]SMG09150.1 signal peptidase, endoplasmic reticulum-type [Agreia pratensis]